jgi:hypothetical protein
MKDPLPVGTLVGLRSADSLVSMRVLHVVESTDGPGSGMQVRPAGSDDAGAAMWIPPRPAAKPASTPSTTATQAPPAASPPASAKPAPVEAAPAGAAAAESASGSQAAAPAEGLAPAGGLMTEAVAREVPVAAESGSKPAPSGERTGDAASVGKEEQPASGETVPAESAAPVGSTDRAAVPQAVPQAVPVAVGSSLTGALEGAAASESEGLSGAVETSGEWFAPGDGAPPLQGDLPPARPVQTAGGRRRTKRRR